MAAAPEILESYLREATPHIKHKISTVDSPIRNLEERVARTNMSKRVQIDFLSCIMYDRERTVYDTPSGEAIVDLDATESDLSPKQVEEAECISSWNRMLFRLPNGTIDFEINIKQQEATYHPELQEITAQYFQERRKTNANNKIFLSSR